MKTTRYRHGSCNFLEASAAEVSSYRRRLQRTANAIIDEMVREYEIQLTQREERLRRALADPNQTQKDLVIDLLVMAGVPLTARQIADALRLDTSSVRNVLYSSSEFCQLRDERKHNRRWKLASKVPNGEGAGFATGNPTQKGGSHG